ncbi:hypothetical protein [Vibrio vulnificus YJ016]|uniref:Uncharacterized protein n=1 Tax=Vibrio vulnificus (strain YJ016) TaxID=196600 RepID=Q7MCV0_VIBVY|nr:hypothetical protein [Vibrio vulnificus YJ016]
MIAIYSSCNKMFLCNFKMKNNSVGIFLHGIDLSIFRYRFEINYF